MAAGGAAGRTELLGTPSKAGADTVHLKASSGRSLGQIPLHLLPPAVSSGP